jgi:precorrin-3B methylase
MEKYLVYGSPNNSPLLVIGGAGSGKSSIMAKMADQALAKAHLIAGYVHVIVFVSLHMMLVKC